MKVLKYIFLFIIICCGILVILYKKGIFDARIRVEYNYGEEIEVAASKYNLNENYLKALCVLESSGHRPSGSRFEKKVYKRLILVKLNKKLKYGSITHEMIKDASDGAIRNLATSWGPFQLMGYKCLEMGIHVTDIRGENSVDWSVKWINKNYGNFVRKQKYADAFHIHNTGAPVPKSGKFYTYNKNYIPFGLQLIEYFSN